MHKFFFNNECLPACENLHEFVAHLSNTLLAYDSLAQASSLQVEKGVIMPKLADEMTFGGAFSLKEAIDSIEHDKLRVLAYGYFNKYPLDDFLNRQHELAILEKEYVVTVNGEVYDALYLAWVGKEDAFLFTVALHPDLQKDTLKLTSKDGTEEMQVNNLYGASENTDFIRKYIESLNLALLDTWERLLATVKKTNDAMYSTNFERDFRKLNQAQQQSIIDDFQKAKERNLASPFYPDIKLIKDVSPQNAKCKVYELRIYTPTALRVYFHETENTLFLASIEAKSNPDQNQDIKTAHNLLLKLIRTQ